MGEWKFDLGGVWTHDLRIRSSDALPTELPGQDFQISFKGLTTKGDLVYRQYCLLPAPKCIKKNYVTGTYQNFNSTNYSLLKYFYQQ